MTTAHYTTAQQQELAEVVRQVVVEQYGRTDVPIVLHADVRHTDPQWLVPFGIEAEIASTDQRISLIDSIFG
ncbi:MAG: hypothetical protein AAFS02_14200 [Pseudomonadota bacterium]